MSDNKNKIKKYWQSINKKAFIIIFFSWFVFLTLFILFCLFSGVNIANFNTVLFITLIFISIFCLQYSMYVLFVKPHKQLLDIIMNLTFNAQATETPIEAIQKHNNFSEVLKFLLKTDIRDIKKTPKTTIPNSSIESILEKSPIGWCILDKYGKVVKANASMPDIKNLAFTNQPTITQWINDSKKNEITATKVWTRIANNPIDENSKQYFYDIEAHFRKDCEDMTFLIFIDKTEFYQEDQGDLNFIAFAAHELRGPITIIRGYLEILIAEIGSGLSNEHIELFERLTVSANKLSGYVNNILNVSRLDQNRLSFTISEHSIDEAIDSIKEDVILRATSQNRLIEFDIPEKIPAIGTDLSGFSEVLTNLIDNAIKYSNDGGLVKITAERAGNFVNIKVQDWGIGIPLNVMPNLFQKFYRSHRSRETVAGTGIGLYLSQAIATKMGGEISVESTEGEGSIFTFSIPIYKAVANQLQNKDINIIRQSGGGWIRNHGKVK